MIQKSAVPILLYHRIEIVSPEADPSRLSISPKMFETQMRYLHKERYQCLSLNELLLLKAQKQPLAKKSFVLTFDDGYKDNFSNAYPIIKKYGFSATIFLVVDCLGQESNWQGATGKMAAPLMNWTEILEMQENGITFGSHTHSHARLPLLSTAEIVYEVQNSKRVLEKNLGREITLFSYPYEALDERSVPIVKDSGYLGACGFSVTIKESNFNLWRVECRGTDTLAGFRLKLSGLPQWWLRLKTHSTAAKFLRKALAIIRP